ncbi:MAG TPA: acetamidase/formamidase family protein, partial [Armatimonadota bacterium]
LPISVPGALFSFGDGYAAQGDGESGDSAIECPMEMVKLRLTLREDMPIKWPMADTPSGLVTFGFHEELEKASFVALSGMLDVMVERLGVSRKEAAMLASLAVDLRVTQIVNPTVGVHAVWPHDALIKRLKR